MDVEEYNVKGKCSEDCILDYFLLLTLFIFFYPLTTFLVFVFNLLSIILIDSKIAPTDTENSSIDWEASEALISSRTRQEGTQRFS